MGQEVEQARQRQPGEAVHVRNDDRFQVAGEMFEGGKAEPVRCRSQQLSDLHAHDNVGVRCLARQATAASPHTFDPCRDSDNPLRRQLPAYLQYAAHNGRLQALPRRVHAQLLQ